MIEIINIITTNIRTNTITKSITMLLCIITICVVYKFDLLSYTYQNFCSRYLN